MFSFSIREAASVAPRFFISKSIALMSRQRFSNGGDDNTGMTSSGSRQFYNDRTGMIITHATSTFIVDDCIRFAIRTKILAHEPSA